MFIFQYIHTRHMWAWDGHGMSHGHGKYYYVLEVTTIPSIYCTYKHLLGQFQPPRVNSQSGTA